MTSSPGQRHSIRQAVIVIIAAVSISAVAALIMIWIAGLSGSLLWSVIAGLLITLLLSLIIGLLLRRDVLGPLATDRDAYVYDRIGTGASTRLTDPTGYTTARVVQDLEAVRVHSGAPQVVLHGHSWGALIVVAYAQQHPDHVAALVLSAPGDLPFGGAQPVAGDLTTRLESGQKTRLYLQLMRPRNLFAYALTSADARVAHSLAGDQEMDRRFARIYRASTPALFCDERLADRVGTNGLGYYAHYVPQLHPDPGDEPLDLSRLAMIKAPVLVIKPACDYLPWSSIAAYQQAFPQAKFVMVPGAGHVAHLEQPALYIGLVHAFLAGQQLPLPTTDVTTIPDGYRGTR